MQNRYRLYLAAIFMAAFMLAIAAVGASGTSDADDPPPTNGTCGNNLNWTYDSNGDILTITGTGAMFNYSSSGSLPWSTCKEVVIGPGVETIGDYAFYNCTSLKTVTFDDIENSKLTKIGVYAFSGSGLTTVTIPKSVTTIKGAAFSGCTGLTPVTFSDGSKLTEIGGSAFSGCTALTTVTIPNSVTLIDTNAFSGSGLTTVTIPKSVNTLREKAFYQCTGLTTVTFTEGSMLKGINENVFGGCTSLTSVTIPDSVTYIGGGLSGGGAFRGCTSLTSVTIPDSVTLIHFNAFRGCTSLTTVTFSEDSKLETIDSRAFQGCTSLATVTIPKSVKNIGNSAFYNCSSLTTVTFSEDSELTTIGGNAFSGSSLTTVTIPKSVKNIGAAFEDCTSLTSVTFSEGSEMTTIGENAFRGCTGLTTVTIPDSVTTISHRAFSGSGLTTVTIPKSVKNIDAAFSGCKSLASVTFSEGSEMTTIGENAFNGCTGLTSVTIPDSVTTISYGAFSGSGLTSVTIPDSVTTISGGPFGRGAFNGCTSLTSVNFSQDSKLEIIGMSAFGSCTSLTSVIIPDSVTTIGENAFIDCASLTSVTFPEGENSKLTSIEEFAFFYCQELNCDLVIPSSVTSIGNMAFSSYKLASITVLGTGYTESVKKVFDGMSFFKDGKQDSNPTWDVLGTDKWYGDGNGKFYQGTLTVDFDTNGGSGVAPASIPVTYGGKYGDLPDYPDPQLRAFFTGWFAKENGVWKQVTKDTDVMLVPSTQKLYAHWDNYVKVTFDGNGNDAGSMDPQYIGASDADKCLKANGFEKEESEFVGWYEAGKPEKIYDDKADVLDIIDSIDQPHMTLDLIAKWNINQYPATFDLAGGSVSLVPDWDWNPVTVDKYTKYFDYGTKASVIIADFGDYSKTGYTRLEETVDSETLGKTGMNIKANWDPKKYLVIDEVTGGTLDSQYVGHHQEAVIIIKADSGHSLPASVTLKMGADVNTRRTAADHFDKFTYNDYEETIRIDAGIITGPLTVTAVCTEHQLTVTFDGDGGHGTMENQVIKYTDADCKLSKNAFTKEGYSFSGWNGDDGKTYSDMQDVSKLIASPDSALNLTAKWDVKFKVTVDTSDPGIASVEYMIGEGGTFVSYTAPFEVVHGSKLTLRTVVEDGYEFREWQPSGETDVQLVIGSVTGDMELTPKTAKLLPEPPGPTPPGPGPEPNPDPTPAPKPKFQVITVTVTFESVGGGHTSEESVRVPLNSKVAVYGTTLVIGSGNATVKAIPDAGHVFSGWMMDEALFLGGGLVSDTVITASFGETVLAGMYIWKEPDKVDYSEGEKFDPAGLVIALRYSDGSEVHVEYEGNESKFSFDPSLDTPLKPSDEKVTVKYGGMSAVQEITVSENGFPWWIVLIVAALALLILFIVLKRRKDEEEESVG